MTLILFLVIAPVVLTFVLFCIIFLMDRYSDEDDWDDEDEELCEEDD